MAIMFLGRIMGLVLTSQMFMAVDENIFKLNQTMAEKSWTTNANFLSIASIRITMNVIKNETNDGVVRKNYEKEAVLLLKVQKQENPFGSIWPMERSLKSDTTNEIFAGCLIKPAKTYSESQKKCFAAKLKNTHKLHQDCAKVYYKNFCKEHEKCVSKNDMTSSFCVKDCFKAHKECLKTSYDSCYKTKKQCSKTTEKKECEENYIKCSVKYTEECFDKNLDCLLGTESDSPPEYSPPEPQPPPYTQVEPPPKKTIITKFYNKVSTFTEWVKSPFKKLHKH